MSSQAQDASCTITTERQNFARICWVLVDICTFIMRDILRQEIPESQFSTELAKNQQQSKGKIKLNSSQSAILFPQPSNAYSGSYSDFDITLLYTLLRNLCAGIQPHRNGWGNDPDPADRSTSANIERLRLLRNAQFGHLSDASVSVADFQTIWKHIRQIVVDFEQVLLPANKSIKGSYTDKVDDLEKTPLDPSLQMKYISLLKKQTYIEDDFKNIKDDLKTQANEMKLLKAKVENDADKFQAFTNDECNAILSIKSRVDYLEEHSKINKAVRTDSIKQNVAANTKARLKSHANNACYTSTVAVDATLDALSDNQIASITGRAGAGKTTAALEVMRRLSDKSSTTEPAIPAIIDEAVNWDTVINCNNKTVVLLDDPFGKTNFDQSNYDRWERKFDSIVSCVEMGKVSVIFVVRSNIFEEFHDNIKNHRIIEKVKVINFSMQTYVLSEANKYTMLNTYLNFYGRKISSRDLENIMLTNPYYGFPQTCFLFCKNPTLFKLGAGFFIHPDVSLRNEMEHLRKSRNDTKKCQYCVLVYILLYKSINATTISMAKMKEIGSYIQIKTILITDIEEAIKSLLGIYLKESQNGYEFYHTTILEAVFLSFGYLSPTMVFQNCSENILYEMVKAPGYQLKENEIGLIMQKSNISVLVDRLLSTDQYENENRFLVYLSDVCSSLDVEEILSTPSKHVSVQFKFFMACRFGKSELVTKYLSKSKPGFIQGVKMAVSSTSAKYSLSDVIIKYGLELAVVCDHLSTVKILIQNDEKLFLFCVDNNWFKLIETIIRDDPSMVHFPKYDRDTLMLYAARKNRLEITKCLYEQGKNIRSRLETKHMLHFICIQNDWFEILDNLLLKDPALINLKDSDGRSPICYAGFLKRKNMVKFLQRFNPKVTERDNWGKSLLHYCVENSWYDVIRTLTPDKHLLVKLLYEECKPLIWYAVLILDESVCMFQGIVSCHLHDSCGKTLLHKCVDNSWYGLLEKLVNDNPTVADVRDANGDPFICYVARENKEQVVMLLIKFNCDVKQTDFLGKTLLHYCIDNDWNDILDRLFENNLSLVNTKDKFGDPLICYASRRSKKDVVVMMCHRNVDVKQYNFWGKTVLHYCVDNDWVDILKYIIGRDPYLVYFAKSCKEEDSLIYYAHRSNAKFIVEYLLRQNAKGTIPISISYTLLYVCIDNYLFDRIVDLLKTEPKLVDKEHTLYGLLPIGYAARKRNKSMVEHLIKCNANVTLRDRCGKSVLHYCVENGWYDVIRTLHSNIRSLIEILYHEGEPLLWYASRIIDDSTCKYPYEGNVDGHLHDSSGKTLLHKCVDNHWYVLLRNIIKDSPTVVNVRDSNGDPFICYAARQNKKQIVRLFIDSKFEVHYGFLGKTLLHHCIDNDWCDILTSLFKDNPSFVNTTNNMGEPLICYASRRHKKEVVALMCSHNVDVKQFDFWGKTLLHYCIDNDWVDEIETLIQRDLSLANITNSRGESLVDYSTKSNACYIGLYLFEHSAKYISNHSTVHILLHGIVDTPYYDKLESLLKSAPEILNMTDDQERSLLCYAALMKQKQIVFDLLKLSADFRLRDNSGKSALFYFVENGWYDIVRSLATNNRTLVNMLYDEGEPLIWYASCIIDQSSSSFPHQSVVDGHLYDSRGKTLLHKCVDNGWYDLLENLIKDNPAVVNITDANGDPFIQYSARQNAKQTVRVLIDSNCKGEVLLSIFKDKPALVNITNTIGEPLICCASRRHKKDVVALMCSYNVNVSLFDFLGKTLLHYCIDNDWVDLLETLIEKDMALVNLTNFEGESLVSYAAKSKAFSIALYLIKHGAKCHISLT